eukprot:TRINITY_DN4185_c0_g1_i1.p1 TRINITY_DN4185_c0_g1~~TRINITY_DN4185_c0_g1_i1.p1  ORF type:complete len:351 (-),score=56.74 TRINITY_DN4185_c0_g1_i1:10-1062(-)
MLRVSRATFLSSAIKNNCLNGKQIQRFFNKTPPVPPQIPRKRTTITDVFNKYKKNIPITMVTAYDYPSAVHVNDSDIDILLVGDSVGMVELGYDTTVPVTLDDMLHHCKAVARGANRPFLVGDLPFGTYEVDEADGVRAAIRLMKEGNMQMVKLEGHFPEVVRKMVKAGVPVMGHVGLTPQRIAVMGGFKPQGRTLKEAKEIYNAALDLERAGASAIVIECVPEVLAEFITKNLKIPTIGIGAGSKTSGQVLVFHDLTGMMQHPHHKQVTPRFCKRYSSAGEVIQQALQEYHEEVTTKRFPTSQYCPYVIPDDQWKSFLQLNSPINDETDLYPPKNSSNHVDDNPEIKLY